MNPAKLGHVSVIVLAIILVAGCNTAFASAPQVGLALNMRVPVGAVTNLGTQKYTVVGGTSFGGVIEGMSVNPGGSLQYNLVVTQDGMTTVGHGDIRVSGTTAGGMAFTVSGDFVLDASIAAGTVGSSELPLYFVSSSPNVEITIGGSTSTLSQPLLIESPYWNPFGGPITIASQDGVTLAIAASYSVGLIHWQDAQVSGPLLGSVGPLLVAGLFSTNSTETENLVSGNAVDSGTIAFSNMSPSSLNSQGHFAGQSVIPTVGESDCSSLFPVLPGTCTFTGFQSQGSFKADEISGSYSTEWSSPAIAFSSTIAGTVSAGK